MVLMLHGALDVQINVKPSHIKTRLICEREDNVKRLEFSYKQLICKSEDGNQTLFCFFLYF